MNSYLTPHAALVIDANDTYSTTTERLTIGDEISKGDVINVALNGSITLLANDGSIKKISQNHNNVVSVVELTSQQQIAHHLSQLVVNDNQLAEHLNSKLFDVPNQQNTDAKPEISIVDVNVNNDEYIFTLDTDSVLAASDFVILSFKQQDELSEIIVPLNNAVVNGERLLVSIPSTSVSIDSQIDISASLNAQPISHENSVIFSSSNAVSQKPIVMVPEADNGGVNKQEWSNGIDIQVVLPLKTTHPATVYISVKNKDGKLVESAEYEVKVGEKPGDVIDVNLANTNLSHDESYDISAYVVNTTGIVSPESTEFTFYVDLVAPGEGKGPNGEDVAPEINLIEIAPATGDTYINRADMLSIDDGDAIPFTATIPLGSVAGDKLRVYIEGANGIPIFAQYQITQQDIDNGVMRVDLFDSLLSASTVDGQYSLRATVVDNVGNESAASNDILFTYDITAPLAARFNIVDDASSSNVIVDNGDYSNDTLPLINGTSAEAGATIELYDGDNNLINTVTAGDDGKWQYQVTTPLTEGVHQFTTIQIDKAGNRGERSEPFTVNIDLTAPGATGGENGAPDPQGNAIRFVQDDEYINDSESGSVSLAGNVELNGNVVSIRISDGTNEIIIPSTDFSLIAGVLEASNIDVSSLNDGELTVVMEVQDQARNVGSVSDTIVKHPTDYTIESVQDVDTSVNQVAQNAQTDTYTGVTANANDQDGDEVTYHLADTLNGLLRIDSETGAIFLDNIAHLGSSGDVHQALVVATSADGSSSRATFEINVAGNAIGELIDIDDHTEFSRQNLVSENAPKGTPVGITVFAMEDPEDTVVYSLSPADQSEGLFMIDGISGVISLMGNLDYEEAQSHHITVLASSSDGSSATNTFTVNVGDNENGAGGEGTRGDTDNAVKNLIDEDPRDNVIAENSDVGTDVGITAFARDQDGDAVTYRLAQDDIDKGVFAIDSTSGVITLIGDVDFETQAFYDVGVIAESYDRTTVTHTFRVNVEDVNEAPIFTSVQGGLALEMTASVGDTVAQFTARDPDGEDITYAIVSGNDQGYVEINPNTGAVTLTQAGFDALHDNQGNVTTLNVEVSASDGSSLAPVTDSADVVLDEMVNPTVDLHSNSDSGESNTDDITFQNRPVITGTGEPGAGIEIIIDGDVVGRGKVAGNGQYSIRTSILNEGTHEVFVKASDGNNVEQSSMSLTIDRQGIGSISIDNITANNIIDKTEVGQLIDITGRVTGEFESGDQVTATINGKQYQGLVNSDGLTWRIEDVSTDDLILDTQFKVQANGVDVAGNQILDEQVTTHQRYDNSAPIAVDDPGVSSSGQRLDIDTFQSGLEGWKGGRRLKNSLQIAKQKTATKVFDFGEEHAGQTVIISYRARGTSKWDTNGDRIIGAFNDVTVNNKHTNGTWKNTNDVAVKLDSEGKLTVSFKAATNAKNEKAFIDNFTVVGGHDFQDVITTNEDDALTIDVLANDSDPDASDSLSISHINDVSINDSSKKVPVRNDDGDVVGMLRVVNGKIQFEPNSSLDSLKEGERLKLTFDYTITDGFLDDSNNPAQDSAKVTFYVIGTNDAPVIDVLTTELDENSPEIIIGHIDDIDGDLDIANSEISALHGTVFIESDGDIVYTPNTNYDGQDTVTIIARDEAGAEVPQIIELTINNINNAPEAQDDHLPDTGTKENKTLTIDVLSNDRDLDNNPLTITHINDHQVQGTTPIIIKKNGVNIGEAWVEDNEIKFEAFGTLVNGEKEQYEFNYTVSDGDESDKANVSFTLTGVNDKPEITQLENSVLEDSIQTVIGNLSDIDGSIDIAKSTVSASHGQVKILSNGDIVYTPDANYFGQDIINITAVDNEGASRSDQFSLTIENVGDNVGMVFDASPLTNAILEHATNGTPVGITALALDADPNDKVTYSLSAKDQKAGIFEIDKDSGVISLKDGSLLDGRATPIISVTVIATSTDKSTSNETFNINVITGPAAELGIEGIGAAGMLLSDTDDEVVMKGAVTNKLDGGLGNDTITLNMSKEAWLNNVGNIQNLVLNFEQVHFSDNESLRINKAHENSKLSGINTADGNDNITLNTENSKVINTGGGNDIVKVKGDNNEKIHLGTGNNNLTIEGDSNSKITALDDNDVITIDGNTTASIRLNGGNDLLTIKGNSSEINTGAGNDSVDVGGNTSGDIQLGTGNDTIVVAGAVTAIIDGGSGEDSITLNFSRADWDANLDDIQSFIQNFETLIFNDGTKIENFEVVPSAPVLSAGDDDVVIDGDTSSAINTLSGNDQVVIKGNQQHKVTLGTGNNSLEISGDSSAKIITGDERDTVTITGDANSDINVGANRDTVSITGNVNNINAGAGDDILTVGGNVVGKIAAGDGDDIVTVAGDVLGEIDGGAGDNTLSLDMSLIQWQENYQGIQQAVTNFSLIKFNDGNELELPIIEPEQLTNGDDTLVLSEVNKGGLSTREGNDDITITGNQTNAINLGTENDTLVIEGHSQANINTGKENDIVTISNNSHQAITLGEGDDQLTLGKNLGTIDAGLGDDEVSIKNGVSGDVSLGAGDDVITVKGKVTDDIDGGDGNDVINLNISRSQWNNNYQNIRDYVANFERINFKSGASVVSSNTRKIHNLSTDMALMLAAYDDIVTVTSNLTRADLGDGDNELTVSGYTRYLKAGDGDDTVVLGSTLHTNSRDDQLDLGDGNNTLTITGSAMGLNVTTGDGNDELNFAQIGPSTSYKSDVTTGAGNDDITVTGQAYANIFLGAGDDLLTLTQGNVYGTINTGAGNDIVEIRNGFTSDIDTGSGNDRVAVGNYTGAVALGSGNNRLDVTNAVNGALSAGDGQDIVNVGSAGSTINLGHGDNELSVTGAVSGNISVGNGDDEINIGSTSAQIALGDGDNELTATAQVASIIAGDGNDSVDVAGYVTSAHLGAGDNSLVVGGYTRYVSMGDGNDVVSLGSTLHTNSRDDQLDLGDGNNQLTITGAAMGLNVTSGSGNDTFSFAQLGPSSSYMADVETGSGQDSVTVSGIAYANFDLGDGDDTLNITNSYVTGTIDTGSGSDTVTVKQYTHQVNLGSGDNTLTVEGAVHGSITALDGKDVVNVASAGAVDLGAGENELTVANGLSGNLTLGDNNDTVNIGASAQVIDLGEGDNELELTNTATSVHAGAGDDSVNIGGVMNNIHLGDGNNILSIGGYSRYLSVGDGDDIVTLGSTLHTNSRDDQLDLGDGNNKLTVTGAAMGLNVNSGSGQDILNFAQIGPSTSYMANVNVGAGDDQIKVTGAAYANFELGDGDDKLNITTGNVTGTVDGGAGDDVIKVTQGYSAAINAGSGDDKVTVGNYAAAIDLGTGDNTLDVTNAVNGQLTAGDGNDTVEIGSSSASIDLGDGVNEITVDGGISGNLTLGDGNDTATIGAAVTNVNLGDGENTFSAGGAVTSLISGSGKDDVTIDSHATTVHLGDGDNVLNVGGYTRYLSTGDGHDTVTLDSTLHTNSRDDQLDLGHGNNFLTITGNAMGLNINTGDGTDTLDLFRVGPSTSYLADVTTGAGKDTITVRDEAYANFELGGGNDTLRVTNKNVHGAIDSGAGNDVIEISHGYAANITTGDGNDRVSVGQYAATVSLGDGNNNLDVAGAVNGTLSAGSGRDIVSIGSASSTVNLGDGDNELVVDAQVSGNLDVGDGDDTITIGTSATNVTLGDGTNRFTAGTNVTSLNAGRDKDIVDIGGNLTTVHLGDGDNELTVDGYTRYLSTGDDDDVVTLGSTLHTNSRDDQLDLGDGDNTLTITGNAMGLNVNTGSGTDVLNFAKIGPSTSYMADVTTGAGRDTVTVTEVAYANFDLGDGDDILKVTTSNVHGTINTGAGHDTIEVDNGFAAAINTGAGNDDVSVANYTASVDLGEGRNTLNVTNNVNGNISGGDSKDTVTVGTVSGTVNLGDGANEFTVTNSVSGQITLGKHNDTVVIGTTATSVDLGDGNNNFSAGSYVSSLVNAGTGDDIIDITGYATSVHLGDGDNTLNVGGYTRYVSMGAGDDVVTLASTLHTNSRDDELDLGGGDNTLTITGNAMGLNITSGGGDDTFDLQQVGPSSSYLTDVDVGAGDDFITVAKTSYANFDMGSGRDYLKLAAGLTGTADGGDGHDAVKINQTLAQWEAASQSVRDQYTNFEQLAFNDITIITNALAEDVANGSEVGIQADLNDLEGDITYSIVDENGKKLTNGPFTIDANTGLVTVNDASQIDFENQQYMDVIVQRKIDGGGKSNEVFRVEIADANDSVVAHNDLIATDTGGPGIDLSHVFTFDQRRLLANDVDQDGDALEIVSVKSLSKGNVELNNDGTITFTPGSKFKGTATFEYTVSDGNSTDTAKVTVKYQEDKTAEGIIVNEHDLNVSGRANVQVAVTMPTIELVDDDGSESIIAVMSGIKDGFVLRDSSDASHVFTASGSNNSVDISGWNLANLTIQADANETSEHQMTLSLSTRESNGGAISSVTTVTFTVGMTRCPIILDLDGDGIETLGLEHGVSFDIDNDGTLESTGWVGKDDGLLVRDVNNDGIINNASELIGQDTIKSDGQRALDGYDALRDLDSNNDGVFNADDEAWSQMQVWQDRNSDGISQQDEMLTLAQAGVNEISLQSESTSIDDNGNIIGETGTYTDSDGNEQQMADVWFAYQDVEVNTDDTTDSDVYVFTQDTGLLETVKDFNVELDKLDLSELLVDESAENLGQYLGFNFDEQGTTILISADGGDEVTSTIILDGVDLSAIYGTVDTSTILNSLMGDDSSGALLISQEPTISETPPTPLDDLDQDTLY